MFTAIGVVCTGQVYQAVISPDFHPFRIDIDYLPAKDTPIRPLLGQLSFIKDKSHWGAAFRFGSLKIPPQDFIVIAEVMGRDFARDFGA